MLNGNARITCIDPDGKAFVDDVKEGHLEFPSGDPHSIRDWGRMAVSFCWSSTTAHSTSTRRFC